MSRENVEVVRRFYEAWDRRDLDETVALLAGDFEFRPFGEWGDLQDVYQGHEGWRSFWTTWEGAWESVTVAIDRIEDLGDRLLSLVHFDRVGRPSGVQVSIAVDHIWTLRKGRVTRIEALRPAEALEAVGLRE